MTLKRLAIVTTHPIQYYAPIFRLLASSRRVDPRIFFTWSQTQQGPIYDPGFGTAFKWDLPLTAGYEHEFVNNIARQPGSDHFCGIRNPDLIRRIETWRADAVLVIGWNLCSHLQLMRHFRRKIPVLFKGDSTLLVRRGSWRSAVRKVALKWIYSHIDVALAAGSNNRDYFLWCGVPSSRVSFVPHCVENERFKDPDGNAGRAAMQWRNSLDIHQARITLLFAGKFIWEKDLRLLIRAFLKAKIDATLILVGNGPLEDVLRADASGPSNIIFLPFQNQIAMPTVYRLGDVFLLPSISETWGLGLNEAMASGCAIIASSQVGAARDLIERGANGWIFEAGDEESLVQTLRECAACGRAELIRKGRRSLEIIGRWTPAAAAGGIESAVLAT